MTKNIFVVVLFSFAVSIQSQVWKQDNQQTKIEFIITNFGVDVDGSFNTKTITTNYNSKNLENSFINAKIAVKSIVTGMTSRDKAILKKSYFDEENYDSILLKSTKIQKDNKGNIVLFADLTIKNIVKKVQLPLSVVEDKNSLSITSNFTINRKDFGVSGGGFVLSKLVKIKVTFRGTK